MGKEDKWYDYLERERLNCVVASQDWIKLFLEAIVEHLPLEESDHAPLFIQMEGKMVTCRKSLGDGSIQLSSCQGRLGIKY